MTGYSNGFKNVNVVHREVLLWSAFEPLGRRFGAMGPGALSASAALRRDAFALWVGRVCQDSQERYGNGFHRGDSRKRKAYNCG